jgi:hypothetical protein
LSYDSLDSFFFNFFKSFLHLLTCVYIPPLSPVEFFMYSGYKSLFFKDLIRKKFIPICVLSSHFLFWGAVLGFELGSSRLQASALSHTPNPYLFIFLMMSFTEKKKGLLLLFFLLYLETVLPCIPQAGLELTILPPQPPECWAYRCVPPRPLTV